MSLPAYRDEKTSVPGSSQSFASLSPAADEHDASSNLPVSPIDDPDDPNVVILKVFEEPTRKGPSQLSNRSTTSPASPVLSPTSTATTSRLVPQPNTVHTDGQNAPVLDIAHNGGWDAQLLQHYRTVISPYILRAQRPEDRQDLFELQAQTYPPVSNPFQHLYWSIQTDRFIALPCHDGSVSSQHGASERSAERRRFRALSASDPGIEDHRTKFARFILGRRVSYTLHSLAI